MAQTPLKLPPGAQLVDDQPAMKLPPGAELVPDDTSTTSADTDFTSNPNGEGLYRMMPASVQGYTDTSKEIQVPFSRVNDAQAAGLHLHPDEQPRYTKDAAHQGEGKTLLERASARVQGLLQPSTGIAGQIPVVPGVDINAVKAAGRVVAGLPEFAKDLASVYYNVARGNAHYSTLLDMVDPGQVPMQLQQQFHEDAKKDPKLAADNLIGTLIGMGLLAKAPEAAKGMTKGAVELTGVSSGKPAEVLRNEIRDTLGVWKNSRKTVEDFGKQSEKVRGQNTAADEANAKVLQEHETKVREAHAAHVQALVDNITENLETGRTNQAAKAIPDARQGLKDQIELDSRAYDQKIADAKAKATQETDDAWDAVRSKTAGFSTDISQLQKITERAADQADPATSALFKRIIKGEQPNLPMLTKASTAVKYVDGAGNAVDRMSMSPVQFDQKVASGEFKTAPVTETIGPDDPGYGDLYEKQFGEPPPVGGGPAQFNRLQRWYSYISNKMYGGGRVESGLYNAYKMVRSAINDAMQDIAKQANATGDLEEARKLHTQKMETFSDSPNEPQTVASKSFSETSPEKANEMARVKRLGMLARYDPSIPALAQSITKTRKALAALPSEAKARAMVKSATEPPELEKPDDPKLKEKDEAPETPNLQAENAQFIADRLREFGKWGQWVVRLLFGGGMAVLMKGKSPEFGGDLLLGSTGVNVLTHVLRSPRVLDWLARPSAEDMKLIATLPPEDAAKLREAIGKLAEEEREKYPKAAQTRISPIMAAWLAGGKAAQPPSPDEVKKRAEELKPAPPGPQSLKITHIFNPTSGQIEAA